MDSIYNESDIIAENDVTNLNLNPDWDVTDVVMSDDNYSCGAASFATVLNNMGIIK